MNITTNANSYKVKRHNYGVTLPTGERTFFCAIDPEADADAAKIAEDLAGGSFSVIYDDGTIAETIAGFTKLRQYSLVVTGDVKEIAITLQEPGLQEQIDLLTTVLNEVLFSVLPGLEGE